MTGIATVLGLALGLVVGIGRIRGGRIASRVALVYVTCTRGVPLLVQIFIVYYGLNQLIGVTPFLGGTLALAICTAGYLAEVIRAGIMSVDPGQQEAAESLGLSYGQADVWSSCLAASKCVARAPEMNSSRCRKRVRWPRLFRSLS
jgi:polar amino acid transport system permease protein